MINLSAPSALSKALGDVPPSTTSTSSSGEARLISCRARTTCTPMPSSFRRTFPTPTMTVFFLGDTKRSQAPSLGRHQVDGAGQTGIEGAHDAHQLEGILFIPDLDPLESLLHRAGLIPIVPGRSVQRGRHHALIIGAPAPSSAPGRGPRGGPAPRRGPRWAPRAGQVSHRPGPLPWRRPEHRRSPSVPGGPPRRVAPPSEG